MLGDNDLAIPQKMMDLYEAQQRITAHNTANAGVKDFHKLQVSFSAELKEAIASGDAERIRNVALHVERARQPGVDTESEAAAGAKNELNFNAFAEIAAWRIRMMRTAVTSK
jgi:flagellar basal body rod protein FlgB